MDKKDLFYLANSWYHLCERYPELKNVKTSDDLKAWHEKNIDIVLPVDAERLLEGSHEYENIMATEKPKTDEEEKQENEKKEKEAREREEEEKRRKEEENRLHARKKSGYNENENKDEASEEKEEDGQEEQSEVVTTPTENVSPAPDVDTPKEKRPVPNFPGSKPLEVAQKPEEEQKVSDESKLFPGARHKDMPREVKVETAKDYFPPPNAAGQFPGTKPLNAPPKDEGPKPEEKVPGTSRLFPGARPKGSPHPEAKNDRPFDFPPENPSRQFPGSRPLETPHVSAPEDNREESVPTSSRLFPGSRPKGSPPIERQPIAYPPANTSKQFPGTRRPAATPRNQQRRGPGNPVSSTKNLFKNIKRVLQAVRLLTGISGGAIAIIFAVIFLFLVFYILFFGDAGSLLYTTGSAANDGLPPVGGDGGVVKNPPIAGFTRAVEGPEKSEYGKAVTYTITYEYDSSVATVPLEDITLIVRFSSNAQFVEASGNPTSPLIGTVEWALSDSKNVSPLTLTLLPNADNIEIVVSLDQKSTSSTSSVGGNACTAPFEGKGYCAVDALAPTFNGDKTKALIASLICQTESGSDPTRINNNCATKDYSVGLFQINLVAHCAGAYQNQDCNILLSEATRLSCENQLLDPVANIQKMYAISQGTYWKPWTYTWPLAEAKLKSCGIL